MKHPYLSPGVHDEFRLSCSTHDLPARLAKRQLVPKKGLIRQHSAIPTSSNLLFPLQLFNSSEGIWLANGCVPNAFFSAENQRGPALAEEASSWNLQPKTMNSFDLFKRHQVNVVVLMRIFFPKLTMKFLCSENRNPRISQIRRRKENI